MKIIRKIVPIVLGIGLIFGACQKATLDKYPKESLELKSVPNIQGGSSLEWTPVKSSDFVRYEIFRSSSDSFDVVKGINQIIGTVTDKDITTFALDNEIVVTDSLITSAKQYYKVAAVLKDRKVVSKAINSLSDWLIAMPSGTISLAFNNHQDMYLSSNTGFVQADYVLNTTSRTAQKLDSWPFDHSPFNGSTLESIITMGTKADGSQVILEAASNSSSTIKFYSASDRSFTNQITLAGVSFVYGALLINGVIYAVVQDFSGSERLGTYSSINGSQITTIALSSSSIFTPTMQISADGSTIVIFDKNSFGGSPELYHYQNNNFNYITTLTALFATSGENIAISKDGNTIIRGNSGVIYDRTGTIKGQITNATGFGSRVMILEDDARFIYFDGQSKITLRSCNDGKVIKTINTGLSAATSFNLIPVLVKEKLLIMATLFNGTQSSSILKQINY
jgi:hypothetical protein